MSGPSTTSRVSEPLGRWDLASALVVAFVLIVQSVFAFTDVRVLWDPGRYFLNVPTYYFAWDDGLSTVLKGLPGALWESTGWYQFMLGAWLQLVGRSPLALALVGLGWVGVCFGAAWVASRRLAGPAAALGTVALTALSPDIIVFGRTSWIHVPEAALFGVMMALLVLDPTLKRRRTAVGLVVFGFLVVQLRESGLVWLGTFFPALLWTTWPRGAEPRNTRRLLFTLSGMALTMVPSLVRLVPYIQRKLVARERYKLQTPPLLSQYVESLSFNLAVVVALALPLFLWFLVRRSRNPAAPMLLGWMLVPVLLFEIFNAGFTNYTPYVLAFTVVGGVGLVQVWRPLAFMAVGLVPFVFIPDWMPIPQLEPLAPPKPSVPENIRMPQQPWTGFNGAELTALLDATCPSDEWHSCHIVVEQGLLYSNSEEYGLLELFLLGEDRVELRGVGDVPDEGWEAYGVDAMPMFYCGLKDDGFRRRAPAAGRSAVLLINGFNMSPVWYDKVDGRCDYYWMTPSGLLNDPSALPTAWFPLSVVTWSTSGFQTELGGFQQRNPEFASQSGTVRVYVDEDTPVVRPERWTSDYGREERLAAREHLVAVSQRRMAALDEERAVWTIEGSSGGQQQVGPGDQQGGGQQGGGQQGGSFGGQQGGGFGGGQLPGNKPPDDGLGNGVRGAP